MANISHSNESMFESVREEIETGWAILGCPAKFKNTNITIKLKQYFINIKFTFTLIYQRWENDPMTPIAPVIESPGPEAIITEHPRHTKNTHSRTIPIMIGLTADEGSMFSARMYIYTSIFNYMRESHFIMPIDIIYVHEYI